MKSKTLILGTAAVTILLSPQGFAQAVVESNIGGGLAPVHEPTGEWIWTAGLGVGATPDYEGGDDYEAVPIPVVQTHRGPLSAELIGLHATSNLFDNPNWRIGPSFNFRQGYGDVDNNRVDSLTDRGSSFEIGAKGGYQFDLQDDASLDLAFEVLADVSSGHEGSLFTPSVDYSRPLNPRWKLGLGANITYADGNYMSHYFSINRSDSQRSGLKNFDADADFKDTAVHASLSWMWTKRWHVHGLAQYKRMLGDAEDSPIVDDVGDEDQFFGAVAITYTWF